METGTTVYRRFMPHWVRHFQTEDLPRIYQEIADLIGVEATIKLAWTFAGTSIYFPKLERALVDMRNQVIAREYNGANLQVLSRRWGLSARHVRHIINISSSTLGAASTQVFSPKGKRMSPPKGKPKPAQCKRPKRGPKKK